MSEKTKYTEIWENNEIESLYKRFSAVVKPFEIPLLAILAKKANEIFRDRPGISIFEIGAGNGQHTQIILNAIDKNHNISYTGIDVSSAQREQFEVASKVFQSNVNVVEYTISSFQDYSPIKQYDVVISQHSWYGIGSDIKNFEKLRDILTDGGVCFIMLNPKGNLSQIAMQNNNENPFSSDDLDGPLTACGLRFERVTSYNDDNTRQSFCVDGKLTQHGLDHFSYLYRKDLQGDERNVIEMIKDAPDEAFRFPTDLIIVRK